MKHILILLALVFSMASVNAQSTSLEQDYQAARKYYLEENYMQAFRLFEKTAEQGEAKAQYYVGLMYELGQGMEQNYMHAVYWYTISAEQGDADAQNNLGFMYVYGQGVERNASQASYWFRRVWAQGERVDFGASYEGTKIFRFRRKK